jgi:O-antigen ligase
MVALQTPVPLNPEINNPSRIIAFTLAVCMVFIRFSYVHQIQTMLMHFNLRMLYIFGIPALLGMVLAGGIQRSFKGGQPAVYWTAFALWLPVATVFSSWKGGSAGVVMNFWRTDLPMLFMIAGLALTWRECKILMSAVAWAVVIIMLSARLFAGEQYNYRVGLEFGSIANPNDYAAHLILVLPFLLWVVFASKNFILRILALGGVGFGLKLIIGSASRGALVAIAVDVVFLLWRGTAKQRLGFMVAGPICASAVLAFTPAATLHRLAAFSVTKSSADTAEAREAIESSQARKYEIQKALEYIGSHPLFGVGPGQFSSFEGTHNIVMGNHGLWHETHNTFAQVGSECGVPGLILFAAGILSTLSLLNRTYQAARKRSDSLDIQTAAFCAMMGVLGFTVAVTFLSFGYSFYFPAMGGFAIVLWDVAKNEFHRRDAVLAGQTAKAWIR